MDHWPECKGHLQNDPIVNKSQNVYQNAKIAQESQTHGSYEHSTGLVFRPAGAANPKNFSKFF